MESLTAKASAARMHQSGTFSLATLQSLRRGVPAERRSLAGGKTEAAVPYDRAKDAAQAVQHWYHLSSAQEVVQPERRYRMTAAAAQEVLQPQRRYRATCAQEVVHVEAMDRAKP